MTRNSGRNGAGVGQLRGNCGIVHGMETGKQLFPIWVHRHLLSLRTSSITTASAAIGRGCGALAMAVTGAKPATKHDYAKA